MPTECFNNGKFTEEQKQNFRYDIENGLLQNSHKSV